MYIRGNTVYDSVEVQSTYFTGFQDFQETVVEAVLNKHPNLRPEEIADLCFSIAAYEDYGSPVAIINVSVSYPATPEQIEEEQRKEAIRKETGLKQLLKQKANIEAEIKRLGV